MSRSLPSNGATGTPRLQVDYAEPGTLDAWLARDDTLAAFGFGDIGVEIVQFDDVRRFDMLGG